MGGGWWWWWWWWLCSSIYVGKGGTPVVGGKLPNLQLKLEMRNKTNNIT